VEARSDASGGNPRDPELASTRIALGCAVLFAIVALIFSSLTWLEGLGFVPVELLRSAAARSSLGAVASAAQVIAGLLAIALTVVAIVIELAANRYTHKITELFVREPINIAAACFYVIATVLCLWISATFDAPTPPGSLLPNAALWASLALATASLIFLLPYFAYVFAYVSPVAVVRRIARQGLDAIRGYARCGEASRRELLECIEELADVARGALEHSDQTIAMEAIDARDLRSAYYTLDQYQRLAAERMWRGDSSRAIAIAGHLRSYALLGDSLGQEYLRETVTYDLSQLIELAASWRSPALDALVAIFLEVDRSGDPSPERAQRHLRVRRVQVQLATAFLAHGDRERAERIRRDLAEESPERLRAVWKELERETDSEFWEFTDRGVNFAYLSPERRALLPVFFAGFPGLAR
jgi:hypothetical protein